MLKPYLRICAGSGRPEWWLVDQILVASGPGFIPGSAWSTRCSVWSTRPVPGRILALVWRLPGRPGLSLVDQTGLQAECGFWVVFWFCFVFCWFLLIQRLRGVRVLILRLRLGLKVRVWLYSHPPLSLSLLFLPSPSLSSSSLPLSKPRVYHGCLELSLELLEWIHGTSLPLSFLLSKAS